METSETNTEQVSYNYARFPREFVSYRWFKPLLVALLAFAFYLVFGFLLIVIVLSWTGNFDYINALSTGYDNMDAYTGPGALLELGSIALLLPSLALATLIVRDRPFSSYSSSRGGWNWAAFFKCLLLALVVMAFDYLIEYVLFSTGSGNGVSRFTTVGLILCVALVPLQCVAEEYIFRGFILQMIGSWTKRPLIAIIISALLFAAGHPYNIFGVIAIFFNGLVWGFLTCKTRGLEATSALHIVNNMLAFLASGFGLDAATSEISVMALIIAMLIDVVYAAAVLLIGDKRGWFAPKRDGVTDYNAKWLARHTKESLPPSLTHSGSETSTSEDLH